MSILTESLNNRLKVKINVTFDNKDEKFFTKENFTLHLNQRQANRNKFHTCKGHLNLHEVMNARNKQNFRFIFLGTGNNFRLI